MASNRKSSVEERITSRLKGFVDALKKNEKIEERFTCRTVTLDLEPTEYDSKRVAATRKQLGASQAVFAQLLGVSPNAVRAWEQDRNPPQAIACRFMDEIRRNPDYWRKRLKESVKVKASP